MKQSISDIEDIAFDDVCKEPKYPLVFHNERGDCLEFILKSGDFKRVRIDDLITVFCSRDTDEIIGGIVKGIGLLGTNHPGLIFLFENHTGKLSISRLLLFIVSDSEKLKNSDPNDLFLKRYKRLVDLAEETDAEADLCFSGSAS